MDYDYSLPVLILLATIPHLISFFLVNRFNSFIAYWVAFFISFGNLYLIVLYFQWKFEEYKRFYADKDGDTPFPPVPVQAKQYKQFYDLEIEQVEINRRMKVGRVLIDQLNSGLDVNLTEAYWVKGKRWGGSRDSWVKFIDELVGSGAIVRVGDWKTAGYKIADRDQIGRLAAGRPLKGRK